MSNTNSITEEFISPNKCFYVSDKKLASHELQKQFYYIRYY